MKKYLVVYGITLVSVLFTACQTQEKKFIIRPEPTETKQKTESWEIIESKNGDADAMIPVWVSLYLNGDIREIENTVVFADKYIFIGENRGKNFNALNQWASAFSTEQDLPRLAVSRIENRMHFGAEMYPDDEYGDFFEAFIKAAIDTKFFGAQIEGSFWIKRRIQTETQNTAQEENPLIEERYDFLILISVSKAVMQNQIRGIMDSINTSVRPTREQAAAINRIKQTFFERF